MKRIDIKISFKCNNNCLHCAQGDKRSIFFIRNKEEIQKILSESKDKYKSVVFTGGEPTLHPDIIEVVEYAKKLKYEKIQIQSNGRRFAYKDFCKEIITAGANQFAIALNGHIPQLHDYLMSSAGSFRQTVKGIINLKSLNQQVITNTVISKPNYRNLPQIAKLLVKLNVFQFQFAFVHIMGNALKNFSSIVPRKTMIMPYVKEGLQIGIEAGFITVMTEAIPYCFMAGYECYVAEKVIPQTKIYDVPYTIENFTTIRKEEGKLKGLKCNHCKYYNTCEGPWKEYPEIFGWDEFVPVKDQVG